MRRVPHRWRVLASESAQGARGRRLAASLGCADARDEITFSGWLADMIVHRVFEPLDEYAE